MITLKIREYHKMARDNKYIKELKIKAIWEAINILKESSNSTINFLTFENVANKANELLENKVTTKISSTSLKAPKSNEFIEIKKEIENYRKDSKETKKIVTKKSSSQIKKMQEQINNLMFEITKYLDDKLLLEKEIELKDKTIAKIKSERDDLYKILNNKS
jgi:vacuolar-type H+-ATPase subunit I/STV1